MGRAAEGVASNTTSDSPSLSSPSSPPSRMEKAGCCGCCCEEEKLCRPYSSFDRQKEGRFTSY